MLQPYSSSAAGQLFIGVAGWHHAHWRDLLGLADAKQEHAALACLCELFQLLEITSAYYHPPEAKKVHEWLAATPRNRPFYFTVRMWNKLIRERTLLLQNDIRLMKAALAPLQDEQKLGALVVPVLPTLRYSESNELWLLALVDTFAEYPLFVENLHASWAKSDTVLRLQDRGIALVERTQTGAPSTLVRPPSQRCAYFRYEGNPSNATPEAQTQLYTETEIKKIATKIKGALLSFTNGFVVFNNHHGGQSLVNALQLQSALRGVPSAIPAALLQAFPMLHKLAANAHQQRDLFEESI